MINANYFFILAAESFAPQILLKINRMSGGARVFYEVLRARALCLSALDSTLSRKMTLDPVDSIDWPFELEALGLLAILLLIKLSLC